MPDKVNVGEVDLGCLGVDDVFRGVLGYIVHQSSGRINDKRGPHNQEDIGSASNLCGGFQEGDHFPKPYNVRAQLGSPFAAVAKVELPARDGINQ